MATRPGAFYRRAVPTPELFDYRDVTASSLADDVEAGLDEADRRVDSVASGSAGTLLDALVALDLVVADVVALDGRTGFLSYVHPDGKVRDAAQEALVRIASWRAALPLRDDLAEVLLRLADAGDLPDGGEEQRLVEHWLRDLRRNGHGLPPEVRVEVRALRDRLATLEAEFQRNVADYTDGLDLTPEELDGLPASFVTGLRPGAAPGTYRVSLDYPEVQPFLAQGRRRDLRERMLRKVWSTAAETNRAVLTAGLEVRRRLAELLGYPSWAAYRTEVQMAGAPQQALATLEQVRTALAPAVVDRLAELQALLVEDGQPPGSQVQHWDLAYLNRMRTERRVGLDPSELADYFPVDVVLDTMFDLLGTLFGLSLQQVPDARAWSEDVQLREVRDADGTLLGHVYLDLHPRDGKYRHAAMWDLVRPQDVDGRRRLAVSALVCNFSAPSDGTPGLMRHDEVVTLFHEFGHALHLSVSTARFGRFAGTETERDFVEAPSQLMERWAWEPAVLAPMARHWRTGEPLDPAVVERLAASRFDGALRRATTGTMLGLLDLALHGEHPVDPDRATREASAVFGVPYPEGTFRLGGFGHLFGGYDAGYYGYLWAEIIGDDMVGRLEQDGLLDPAVARRFRSLVLEPGGSRPADDLVAAFLGRAADPQAYLRARGWAG